MVTLIITTFNEAGVISSFFESLMAQTLIPAEVILVDGGSMDETPALAERWIPILAERGSNLQVRVEHGANIPQGRNIGIRSAAGDVIAVTDAGCRMEPTWLERVTSPIRSGEADMVGGFFLPVADTVFERALAALTTARIPSKDFLPSSRSIAFTKSLWKRVGGYPEWLRWGEDTLFNQICLRSGARYVIGNDAIVHWRVRPNLQSAIKQYYRYGLGDGLALRVSKSYARFYGLTGLSCGLAIAGIGSLCLVPVLAFPAYMIIVKRNSMRGIHYPSAYVAGLGIHLARIAGHSRGVVTRLVRSRWFA